MSKKYPQLKGLIVPNVWNPVYTLEEVEPEEEWSATDKRFNISKSFWNRYEKAYIEWLRVQQELSDRYTTEPHI